jgi:hypothetical protein
VLSLEPRAHRYCSLCFGTCVLASAHLDILLDAPRICFCIVEISRRMPRPVFKLHSERFVFLEASGARDKAARNRFTTLMWFRNAVQARAAAASSAPSNYS